jgi:hypothetical protein
LVTFTSLSMEVTMKRIFYTLATLATLVLTAGGSVSFRPGLD